MEGGSNEFPALAKLPRRQTVRLCAEQPWAGLGSPLGRDDGMTDERAAGHEGRGSDAIGLQSHREWDPTNSAETPSPSRMRGGVLELGVEVE